MGNSYCVVHFWFKWHTLFQFVSARNRSESWHSLHWDPYNFQIIRYWMTSDMCTKHVLYGHLIVRRNTYVSSVGYLRYLVGFPMDWKWIWWFWWLILVLSDHKQWHYTGTCKRHCVCFWDSAYVSIEDTSGSYCKYRMNVYVNLKNIRNTH